MTPVRCSQNHYYDSEMYSSCPHCAQASSKQPQPQSPSFSGRSYEPDIPSAGQGVTMPMLNNVAVPVYGSAPAQPQKKASFFSRFGKKKDSYSQESYSQNNTVPLNVQYTPDSVTEVLSDSPFASQANSGSDVFIRNQSNATPTYSDPNDRNIEQHFDNNQQNGNIPFQGDEGASMGNAPPQQENLYRINPSFPQSPIPGASGQNLYHPQQPQQPPQRPERPEMGGQNLYQPQQPQQPPQRPERPEMGGQNLYQPQQPQQPPQRPERPEMGGQNQHQPQQPPQRPASNVHVPAPVTPPSRPNTPTATNTAPAVPQRKVAPSATQSDSKTVAFYDLGDDEEPVVGWLVCVKGEYLGVGFNLSAGRNNIGRSANMSIALPKCPDIERERHAVITFDPQNRKFYLQPGENNTATQINGKVLTTYAELVAYDMILLGNEQFVFVPLCGERFAWDKYLY